MGLAGGNGFHGYHGNAQQKEYHDIGCGVVPDGTGIHVEKT